MSTHTQYDNLKVSIVMDLAHQPNGATLRQTADSRLRFIHGISKDNRTEKLNQLIENSAAEIIGFLAADHLQFSPTWLQGLLAVLSQEGVGAVAPKLVYPNGLIFSCGIILGADELTQRSFNGVSDADPLHYFGWASLNKGYSALPNECILFKRAGFLKVKGFNEEFRSQSARMIDLCLKLRTHGLRNVLVPEVIITINKSSGFRDCQDGKDVVQNPFDIALLQQRWEKFFEHDPAFNPNLTLHQGKPIVKAPSKE
jgi:hypothetical protein